MKTMQRWHLDSNAPYCLTIAADARLSSTDYHNDQIWEALPGNGESPALALQTRLGGRAGLVSFVPMWLHDGRSIYQAQAYSRPPYLTGFAPGYLRFEAAITPHLALQTEYWAMESHAIGVRFTIANVHTEALDVELDVIAFVGMNNKEQKLIALLSAGALSLGAIGNLQPVILLEDGQVENEVPSSPKLKRAFTIEGRKKLAIRLVHAGLGDVKQSLALAQKWLKTDWDAAFAQIDANAQAIPQIHTGDTDSDATIAFAYRELTQSFLKATSSLPYPSFVATREPGRGANTNDKGWNGQSPTLAYLAGLGIASVDAGLAQGIIGNYLAVQQNDGWIDNKPGLAGQKQNVLCMPILARLSWGIFQYTEDSQFLKDAFPKLLKFFQRWLQPDLDKDIDGLAEWQNEVQTGYVFIPTFSTWQAWGGGADIRTLESPDLIAYLLSEAKSLKEIAYYLRDVDAEKQMDEHITRLESALENLWNADLGRYTYRDRDTHLTTGRVDIIKDARGMDELLPAEKLNPPNRLVVRVSGGVNLLPKMTLKFDGFDPNGKAITEQATGEQFIWAGGRGVYTSKQTFLQIDRITFEGLSRVYRVDVHTVDTTRLDINALIPLWSASVSPEHAQALLSLLTDSNHFWRESGISMNSAQDANFDPKNADGSGGVWPYWLTLIGEALIESGHMKEATELLQRILRVQIQVLKSNKRFSEFYNSEKAEGLGEPANVAGIVPLHLLMRVIGVRVTSSSKVWVGGKFTWGKPVTVQQRGVLVVRQEAETKITFPSGYSVTVSGDEWQEVVDPNA